MGQRLCYSDGRGGVSECSRRAARRSAARPTRHPQSAGRQPPWALQSFLPAQSFCSVLQFPLPLHSFMPLQQFLGGGRALTPPGLAVFGGGGGTALAVGLGPGLDIGLTAVLGGGSAWVEALAGALALGSAAPTVITELVVSLVVVAFVVAAPDDVGAGEVSSGPSHPSPASMPAAAIRASVCC